MKRDLFRPMKWVNVIAFLAMVTVNALAVLLPLNGVTPGQVSDAYPTLFAPAGITFSIWSVIYLLLLLYTLYQAGLFAGRAPEGLGAAKRIGPLFALSSLFNIAWIFCWHFDQIPLSLLCMLGLLATLIAIYRRMGKAPLSMQERFMARIPFSIYFGWITVATIANVSAALVSLGWDRFGLSESFWTTAILLVGLAIGLAVILPQQNVAYGLTMTWAYLGIFIKHNSASGWNGQYPVVLWTAAVAGAVLLGASVFAAIRNAKRIKSA